MRKQFDALFELIREPLQMTGGLKTENSIRFVYPPEKELDFRDCLFSFFVPLLQSRNIPFLLLDLGGFLFEMLDEESIEALQAEEFSDYRWMKQALSRRIETHLPERLADLAGELPGGTIIVHGAVALYPLIRFGDILKGLRDLPCRIVLSHPGEDRDGKVYFMDQPDSGNYLTINLT